MEEQMSTDTLNRILDQVITAVETKRALASGFVLEAIGAIALLGVLLLGLNIMLRKTGWRELIEFFLGMALLVAVSTSYPSLVRASIAAVNELVNVIHTERGAWNSPSRIAQNGFDLYVTILSAQPTEPPQQADAEDRQSWLMWGLGISSTSLAYVADAMMGLLIYLLYIMAAVSVMLIRSLYSLLTLILYLLLPLAAFSYTRRFPLRVLGTLESWLVGMLTMQISLALVEPILGNTLLMTAYTTQDLWVHTGGIVFVTAFFWASFILGYQLSGAPSNVGPSWIGHGMKTAAEAGRQASVSLGKSSMKAVQTVAGGSGPLRALGAVRTIPAKLGGSKTVTITKSKNP